MLRKSALSLFALLCFAFVPAQAAGIDSAGYVGGTFGLNIPDYEDTSARAAFGIVGGAKLGTELGLGGYFLSSNKEETINGARTDFNYSMYGIEGAYHFEGEAAGVYLGLRLGLTNVDTGVADFAPYHWALLAGYNHWLMDNFSLGGEASFTSVAKDEDTLASGATASLDAFNIIGFMATAKFWF